MSTAVVVFAREPVPGEVKTRLAAEAGERVASRVYSVLLDRTLAAAAASSFDLVVSLAEAPSRKWSTSLGWRWEVQEGNDLGARMRDAFDRRFGEDYDRVITIGSDCPSLHPRHLLAARRALDAHPVVLGPARDGGYWLVAQKRPGVDLFAGVPWSSLETLAATRTRLAALDIPWIELDILGDIDTARDLRETIADSTIDPGLRRDLRFARND